MCYARGMTRVMVIQHIACEPLGEFALAGDADFFYIRPYAGDAIPDSLTGCDALIVLGGPMAVYDQAEAPYLARELNLLSAAIAADFPVLGICLGSQLIAAAAGARVYPGPVRETGWGQVELTEEAGSDALMAGLPDPLPVFQLHGDTFDLPAGAARLATGRNYENQAFRLGSRVYGLQFHIEVNEALARDWAAEYAAYIAESGTDAAEILAGPPAGYESFQAPARLIIQRFLALCR